MKFGADKKEGMKKKEGIWTSGKERKGCEEKRKKEERKEYHQIIK